MTNGSYHLTRHPSPVTRHPAVLKPEPASGCKSAWGMARRGLQGGELNSPHSPLSPRQQRDWIC
ncbi:MAG: hypothetical protein AB4290_13100 [Spirulina sp.]